jgi:hypothetical protein
VKELKQRGINIFSIPTSIFWRISPSDGKFAKDRFPPLLRVLHLEALAISYI